MKGEAPGDQTVTSHKALFTKDTHTPPPPFTSSTTPPNISVHQSSTLPKSARAGTWETALILPPGPVG